MKTKFLLFLISLFVFLIFEALTPDYPGGFTGVTKRDGGTGCICHGPTASPNISVLLIGPDSVAVGQSAVYQLKVFHGPAQTGGCDIASYHGIIDTSYQDLNTLKRDTIRNELTHRFPKGFLGDSVVWTFKYIAPGSVQVDTLYSIGNSTNNDFLADTLDKWNFSENKPIRVYIPIGIEPISNSTPTRFKLYQNFPNPFNPSTKIKFDIPNSQSNGSKVSLIVYNIIGNEVATILNEKLSSGSYEINWNGSLNASGIYFIRLQTDIFSDTKKMILIR